MISYHDTHFHLDLFENPTSVAETIERSAIYTIAVTNAPSVFHFTEKLSNGKKFLRAALGFHPELVFQRSNEFDLFAQMIGRTRYIGEVGLDNFNKSPADYAQQKKVFSKLVDLCTEQTGKILTIHSRRASADIVDILSNQFQGKAILHWYSGPMRDLKKAIDAGLYFSINLPMTVSEAGTAIIREIPVDRLLTESDGPFTKHNGRPCSPSIASVVVEGISKQLGVDWPVEKLAEQLSQNFQTLNNYR